MKMLCPLKYSKGYISLQTTNLVLLIAFVHPFYQILKKFHFFERRNDYIWNNTHNNSNNDGGGRMVGVWTRIWHAPTVG